MSKEEILAKIDALEAEAVELKAEQEAINHLLSLVLSTESSRADEIGHQAQRRQDALHARVARWQHEIQELEDIVAKMAA